VALEREVDIHIERYLLVTAISRGGFESPHFINYSRNSGESTPRWLKLSECRFVLATFGLEKK
jgi:hypothetical protein